MDAWMEHLDEAFDAEWKERAVENDGEWHDGEVQEKEYMHQI